MFSRLEKLLWFWSVVGLLFGLWYLQEPSPYRDVDVLRIEREGPKVHLIANFLKTDCEFIRLNVVGIANGVATDLPWKPSDGGSKEVDRTDGLQTLNISFLAPKKDYDRFEVRTTHKCDGTRVSRTFLAVDPAI
tara:strand:- start:1692 stop:2093 length:402 start_codon:yes stop_codon:yes gene_type:complete